MMGSLAKVNAEMLLLVAAIMPHVDWLDQGGVRGVLRRRLWQSCSDAATCSSAWAAPGRTGGAGY
ncbi:MAG TPA: hypothetical protein DD666_10055 [Advenella kashmirensis]|uniref:Uncharacterized protein n=1 Tax=Advenella kashmirensis TaxID=310575 RepID=A0A356LGW8_9BURK|nr:hypothetical protein [Advenella kashmirensis]